MTPTPSRQRLWQLNRALSGLCITCGKPNDGKTQKCESCRQAFNEYQQKLKGYKPWREGCVGRPPKSNLQ